MKTVTSATNGPSTRLRAARISKRFTTTADSSMPAGRKRFFPGRNNRYSRYGPLLLPELEVQDIDTEEDWAIAEVKYQKMMGKE